MPPQPKTAPPQPSPAQAAAKKITFGTVQAKKGSRIVLYGTGGIGKTSLACLAPGPVAFVDADESLPILQEQLKAADVALPLIVTVTDWKSAREALKSDGWEKVQTIVIDTVTKLEEWCVLHTVQNVPNDKGNKVARIEDYGFGKGYQHVYDTFLGILADLDRHVRAGRNVILIAHECTSTVPNPRGEDYLRYEPRLQNPSSGKGSIRHRIKEWADHLLFLGYDVVVDNNGIAQGQGTRTLYSAELPFCMAKSRTTSEQFDVVLGQSIWDSIIK